MSTMIFLFMTGELLVINRDIALVAGNANKVPALLLFFFSFDWFQNLNLRELHKALCLFFFKQDLLWL